MTITVVGLGPGNGRFLTKEAWQVLSAAGTVYLRTIRHPAVADLPEKVTVVGFDYIYEAADSFEQVYETIVAELLAKAKSGDVVYAVPGHPHMGESTVTALATAAQEADVTVRIVPGLSFLEPTLTAVSLDGLAGLQLFDALELLAFHYPPVSPDAPLLLGQVYSRLVASDLKLVLTAVYPEEHPVQLIHAAGTLEEIVEEVPLYAIDRSEHISHLTSLMVPALPVPASLARLAETVAILRSPEGCPWDQEQTPQSMRPSFLEEANEVLEALDMQDETLLCEELGDMLYHLVMQAQMASEEAIFRLPDVIAGIDAKLRHRHPHVWGEWDVSDSDEVLRNWEAIKQEEKAGRSKSLVDNIPGALPALARAQKLQDRVAQIGFDWPSITGVYAKLAEEIGELQEAHTPAERQDELGDLLFVAVNLARWLDVDAESALRGANLKFSHRFRQVEQLATERDIDISQLDLAGIDLLWEEVKQKK
ncbi:MAG: nucleoside triphosphate pyrophosphohydrolase [Chloroflexi bacterium]|nr:MAG: nucleoside triphosphate pyrophosphohydrolase [Chloroflexota bacterium]